MRQIIWSIGDIPHMSDSSRSGLRSVCHSDTIWVGERSPGSTPPGRRLDRADRRQRFAGRAVEDVEIALLRRTSSAGVPL